MIPINGVKLFDLVSAITPNIAYFVPRNTNYAKLARLAGPGRACVVEEAKFGGRIKGTTAYYGELAQAYTEDNTNPAVVLETSDVWWCFRHAYTIYIICLICTNNYLLLDKIHWVAALAIWSKLKVYSSTYQICPAVYCPATSLSAVTAPFLLFLGYLDLPWQILYLLLAACLMATGVTGCHHWQDLLMVGKRTFPSIPDDISQVKFSFCRRLLLLTAPFWPARLVFACARRRYAFTLPPSSSIARVHSCSALANSESFIKQAAIFAWYIDSFIFNSSFASVSFSCSLSSVDLPRLSCGKSVHPIADSYSLMAALYSPLANRRFPSRWCRTGFRWSFRLGIKSRFRLDVVADRRLGET